MKKMYGTENSTTLDITKNTKEQSPSSNMNEEKFFKQKLKETKDNVDSLEKKVKQQSKKIATLEYKIKQLIDTCNNLLKENHQIQEELNNKVDLRR